MASGSANRVERCFVTENGPFGGTDSGIEVTGDGNRISGNDVVDNELRHRSHRGRDRAECADNVWTASVFATSDPAKASLPDWIE